MSPGKLSEKTGKLIAYEGISAIIQHDPKLKPTTYTVCSTGGVREKFAGFTIGEEIWYEYDPSTGPNSTITNAAKTRPEPATKPATNQPKTTQEKVDQSEFAGTKAECPKPGEINFAAIGKKAVCPNCGNDKFFTGQGKEKCSECLKEYTTAELKDGLLKPAQKAPETPKEQKKQPAATPPKKQESAAPMTPPQDPPVKGNGQPLSERLNLEQIESVRVVRKFSTGPYEGIEIEVNGKSPAECARGVLTTLREQAKLEQEIRHYVEQISVTRFQSTATSHR